VFIYKEIKFKELPAIFKKAAITSAVVMFIIACATSFGFMMTRELIPMKIAKVVTQMTDNPYIFLLVVNLLLLFLGTFMETNAAIMLTSPLLMPIAVSMNIDLVLFGIIMVINLAIGMITPPVGVNLYVAAGIHGGTISKVINKHLIMYLLVCIFMLMIITFFPAISLTLPSMVK
jgi:C4-dicarboxylate transporter DctM subunit